jgi:hypothetical protein
LERYKLPGIDQIMAELDHKINAWKITEALIIVQWNWKMPV